MYRTRLFSPKLTAVTLTLLGAAGCSSSRDAQITRDTPAAEAGSPLGDGGEELDGALDPDEIETEAQPGNDAGAASADAAPPSVDAAADAAATQLDAEQDAELDATTTADSSEVDAVVGTDASESDAGNGQAEAAVDASAPDAAESGPPALQPGAITPKPYLGQTASPFEGLDFAYFHREDFEDHQLNAPGLRSVTAPGSNEANGRLSSAFGPSLIDSVDADDGVTDGQCQKANDTCDGWWGSGSLTFSFDATALGALPTHAGVVWTDGAGEIYLEAFGADGTSLYKVGPFSEQGFPNDSFESSVQEDRFLGAYEPNGISAITISNTVGGIEVDHVQFGRAR